LSSAKFVKNSLANLFPHNSPQRLSTNCYE
jgi:hypothetical protein